MAGDRNWFVTNKLKNYFRENGIDRNVVPSQRKQREICMKAGVSSFQLVEFIVFGEVTYKERKQAQ